MTFFNATKGFAAAGQTDLATAIDKEVAEPVNQIVFGTGEGTSPGIDSDVDLTYAPLTGALYVNTVDGSTGSVSVGSPGNIALIGASNTSGYGGEILLRSADGTGAGFGSVINIRAGESGPTGFSGGSIDLLSGQGPSGATGQGGDINLSAGGATDGSGGAITLTAGSVTTSGSGGDITLTAGDGNGTDGGALTMTGGTGDPGGDITIRSGDGVSGADAGNLFITGGTSPTADGGAITITGGTGGDGADVTVQGGNATGTGGFGGDVTVQGGTPTNGRGGNITITGSNGVGTDRDGGNVTITAGAATGIGVNGNIVLTPGTGGTGGGGKVNTQAMGKVGEFLTTDLTVSGAYSIDLNNGNAFDLTLTLNTTFTFDNPYASGTSHSFSVILRQDGTGGRTTTWPASVDWAGGVAPTLSLGANDVDILSFMTVDGGTTWFGFPGGLNFF